MCPPTPMNHPRPPTVNGLTSRLALRVFLMACALLLAWAQFRPTLVGESTLDRLHGTARQEALAPSTLSRGLS